MRLSAALLVFICLSACSVTPAPIQAAMVRPDDAWRERQAILDADAIVQGMAQARHRAQELARSSR
jgi:hypothetical protein